MTKDLNSLAKELIKLQPKDLKELATAKRRLAKKFGLSLPTNSLLIAELKKIKSTPKELLALLKRRLVRTMSGIAPVAVLTAPFPCPGRCAYCPTDKNIPQSYLSNEPAVMRAVHCNFNPYEQVIYRLRALEANGHEPTKIELIVIGGTWSVLPLNYQYWFVKECFRATNDFSHRKRPPTNNPTEKTSLTKLKTALATEQHKNEKATYQIIGLTLETRPDFINQAELWRMRQLGATRVEMGVQALDDKILKLNLRDSTVADITKASALLKNFGFKVTYHFMPALPGSTPQKDLQMFRSMFSSDQDSELIEIKGHSQDSLKKLIKTKLADNNFNPDQIKFYPTVVTKGSLLYKWWQQGKYQPYTDQQLKKLIIDCKKIIPPFVRIIRLIRDIPGESIMAGNKITNLRQILKLDGVSCRCIRCREIGQETFSLKDVKLFIRKYRSSNGDEYFISFENSQKTKLYGFARLRLPETNGIFKQTALLRELHVYGQLVSVGQSIDKTQHQGLGKRLLNQAEIITQLAGYCQLAVISGVGVRGYYKKLGYKLQKTYLVKKML